MCITKHCLPLESLCVPLLANIHKISLSIYVKGMKLNVNCKSRLGEGSTFVAYIFSG